MSDWHFKNIILEWYVPLSVGALAEHGRIRFEEGHLFQSLYIWSHQATVCF